jgi:thiol-disulfide isomerase/thioredoxin
MIPALPSIMLDSSFLRQKFEQAHDYHRYVEAGTGEQRRRWGQVYDMAALTDVQRTLLGSFVREVNVLVVSGIWCGDCVQQVPLLQRIAEASPRVRLRVLDRDEHADLSSQVRINGGARVPTVFFLAEDFEFCALAGDRTLSRYRAIAQRQLGPSCATGLVGPAPDELAATLQDWVDECEKVHWMLRLSPRLRQQHND